jgi:uroporphyrinogen-III synthase
VSLSVIVTRTLPGARDTADHLARLGYTPLLSPMLTIVETGLDPDALIGVRHIVFTSANGVRPLGAGGLTAWCVGPSTAEAARKAGFESVIEGDGNAEDLAGLILAARPEGPLLHIANEAAAGDLVAALKAGGLDARFTAPYRTDPAAALAPEAAATLASGTPVIVLIHSAKAAAAIAALRPNLTHAALVAISAAAAAPLKVGAGLGTWIAERPNEDSLMEALGLAGRALCP